MPHLLMDHSDDPAKKIRDAVAGLEDFEVFHNQVLLGIYIRPTKTRSGLYLPDKHVEEDRYQSKVGLMLKAGPDAFVDDGKWFQGLSINEGDWLVFRMSDGWKLSVGDTLCVLIDDVNIRGRVAHPDIVY